MRTTVSKVTCGPAKDMALAGLGAIISTGLMFRWSPKILAEGEEPMNG